MSECKHGYFPNGCAACKVDEVTLDADQADGWIEEYKDYSIPIRSREGDVQRVAVGLLYKIFRDAARRDAHLLNNPQFRHAWEQKNEG